MQHIPSIDMPTLRDSFNAMSEQNGRVVLAIAAISKASHDGANVVSALHDISNWCEPYMQARCLMRQAETLARELEQQKISGFERQKDYLARTVGFRIPEMIY